MASYDGHGQLRWATYLGGSGPDQGTDIAADGQSSIYVTGTTDSNDFPVTSGAAQPSRAGSRSAFVTAYDAKGQRHWATYLGGSHVDEGTGITTDGQGTVFIIGSTSSSDFSITPRAVQPRYGGGDSDSFVAAYDASGQPQWATYLGGSSADHGTSIAVDGQGSVYVAGDTTSRDFPVTTGAMQTVFGGATKVFVAHLVVPSGRPAALDPASQPPPSTPHARYFPSTQHTLHDPYLTFWDRLAGIPTLGLPLSEPFTLGGQQVQVTERAVLVRSGSGVQLLPLGRLLSAARSFTPLPPVSSTSTQLYFPSTKHTLSGPFLAYWRAHQGSALLGAPIGEPEQEGLVDRTGSSYLVQWFVNGRLELHPAADGRVQVQQGQVGYEYLHRMGLL